MGRHALLPTEDLASPSVKHRPTFPSSEPRHPRPDARLRGGVPKGRDPVCRRFAMGKGLPAFGGAPFDRAELAAKRSQGVVENRDDHAHPLPRKRSSSAAAAAA